jgi:tape measure domain-containing protein
MAGANIPLSLDNRRFIAGMQQSAGAVGAFVARMNVDLANAGKQADYFTSRFNQGFGRMAGNLKSTGQNLSTFVTAPLAAMAGAAYKTFGDIDALERSLSQYGVTLGEVKQIAKLPGLGIEEAAGSIVSLLSVKYNADLAKRAIIGFGNALTQSGKGKAELEGINTALAQMKGKGKVSAEEINQIAERLPMIRDLMQKAFGTADTEVLQKMGLSADEFLSKITTQLEKLPKATAGPKAILENFVDSAKIGAYEVGKAFERNFALSAKFEALGNKIDELSQRFAGLDPNVQKAILTAAGFAAAAGPVLIALGSIVSIAPKVAAAWGIMTGPVGLAIATIGLLVAETEYAGPAITSALGAVSSFMQGDWKGAWEGGVDTVRNAIATMVELSAMVPQMFLKLGASISGALGFETSQKRLEEQIAWFDGIAAKIAGRVAVTGDELGALNEAAVGAMTGTVRPPKGGGGGGGGRSGGSTSNALGGANPRIAAILAADKKAYEDREKVFGEHLQRMAIIGQKNPFNNIIPEVLKINLPLPEVNAPQVKAPTFMQTWKDSIRGSFGQIIESLPGQFAQLAGAFAQGLGRLGEKDFNIGNFMGEQLGRLLQAFGQQVLSTVPALIATSKALKGALSNPYIAIPAALALIAIGSKIQSNAMKAPKKFAAGGIVSGPVYGLMGEYEGVRTNPEVIAPLAKLRSMLLPMFRQAVDLGRGVSASSVPGPAMLAVHVTGSMRQTGRDLEFVIDQRIKANAARTGR